MKKWLKLSLRNLYFRSTFSFLLGPSTTWNKGIGGAKVREPATNGWSRCFDFTFGNSNVVHLYKWSLIKTIFTVMHLKITSWIQIPIWNGSRSDLPCRFVYYFFCNPAKNHTNRAELRTSLISEKLNMLRILLCGIWHMSNMISVSPRTGVPLLAIMRGKYLCICVQGLIPSSVGKLCYFMWW